MDKHKVMYKNRTTTIVIVLFILIILAAYVSRVEQDSPRRGKVVTTEQSNDKSGEVQIIRASFGMVSYQEDSTGVISGDVCILDEEDNPTDDRIPFVPRKFPKWFDIAADCDKEGDWVEYKLVANGKRAVITKFEKRNE